MSTFFRSGFVLVFASVLTACTSQPSSMVNENLYPSSGSPAAYLVGSIGPQDLLASAQVNQRLLFRKRGSEFGAAGIWVGRSGGTPQDIKDENGAASVFVLRLKPGEYEFYDFQLVSYRYAPGVGTYLTSMQSREKFNVPLRLQPGKAYYLGEFRSQCLGGSCFFIRRDQLKRDEVLARQKEPDLPVLQMMQADFKRAIPFIISVSERSQIDKSDSAGK